MPDLHDYPVARLTPLRRAIAARQYVELDYCRADGALSRRRVRPLGLDRYGVRLRVEGGGADGGDDHDVRLPFPEPVHDITGLGRAIRLLMGCPFVNGLRARRL